MKNICLIVSCKGTNYFGYQRQKNKKTVQGEIERAILQTLKQEVKLTSSSRTDRGVHAECQIANFVCDTTAPVEKIAEILNNELPNDIAILQSFEVPADFSSRYAPYKKTYHYKMYTSKTRLPLFDDTHLYLGETADLKTMKKVAKVFEGTHDFTPFANGDNSDKNPIKTIYESKVTKKGNIITYSVTGSSFLYNQVRMMVSALINANNGKITISEVKECLKSGKKCKIDTAKAHGLTLYKVFIDKSNFKNK